MLNIVLKDGTVTTVMDGQGLHQAQEIVSHKLDKLKRKVEAAKNSATLDLLLEDYEKWDKAQDHYILAQDRYWEEYDRVMSKL